MTSTWKTTTDRFVGFFDIMGFKDLVHRNSHKEIRSRMISISNALKVLELGSKQQNQASRAPIKPVIFSDSILLISSANTYADLESIAFSTTFLLEHCIVSELPIKGAISLGKFTADFKKSIYFGQPLIDAYLLQDELLMYGAVFDHTVESFMNTYGFPRVLTNNYKVPLKSGKVSHYISDWSYMYREKPEELPTIMKNLYNTVSGKPRIYVDNTVEYVNFLIKNPLGNKLQNKAGSQPALTKNK